ncbi:hypothetical protein [Weissella bombi]|uniref:Immunity protein n=1 Tax=Weissella bombi TaxID=1505725 RepID=A0A1C3Z9Q7_9LACO|nr:hypothetical protein [Weissella bombi]SCB79002.1 hypothetical protein GA0061074_101376 [Weissella bombi]
MFERICGVIGILIGIWQFYAVFRAFQEVKQHATKSTSSFLPIAYFSGLIFGVVMFIFGILLLFNWL